METNSTSGLAPVGRLFWMLIGPAILFVLGFGIDLGGGGWFTIKDIVFLATLAGLILGRKAEFRGGDPRTVVGEPATPAHFRRFSVLVLLGGVGAWAVANLVASR